MKFRAERGEFADAAAWVLRTVGARATLPALSGVLLETRGERLHLTSTDLQMTSELSMPVNLQREGSALVPGRLLGEVVRSLPPAAVEADADADRLHLTCGSAQFQLRLMPAEDFPPAPAPADDTTETVVKAPRFAQMVSQVARAASSEDSRPVLTGVSLEATGDSLVAAATDSYRLAVCTLPWENGPDATALVPRRALVEVQRAADALGGEVRMAFDGSRALFRLGERRLVTNLVEGAFPDFRKLLPDEFERRLEVDRAQLAEVVRRVAVVGTDAGTSVAPVSLHLSADTVRVTAGSGEIGQAEESLPGVLEGDDLQIAFNPRYLSDGLDVAGSERVRLSFRDEVKPAVLRPLAEQGEEDPDFLYLLMPVRL